MHTSNRKEYDIRLTLIYFSLPLLCERTHLQINTRIVSILFVAVPAAHPSACKSHFNYSANPWRHSNDRRTQRGNRQDARRPIVVACIRWRYAVWWWLVGGRVVEHTGQISFLIPFPPDTRIDCQCANFCIKSAAFGWRGGWIGHIAAHIRMQTLASRAHAMHNANAYQPPSPRPPPIRWCAATQC